MIFVLNRVKVGNYIKKYTTNEILKNWYIRIAKIVYLKKFKFLPGKAF